MERSNISTANPPKFWETNRKLPDSTVLGIPPALAATEKDSRAAKTDIDSKRQELIAEKDSCFLSYVYNQRTLHGEERTSRSKCSSPTTDTSRYYYYITKN